MFNACSATVWLAFVACGAETPPEFQPLPGKTLGVLVLDARPLAMRDARSGPAEAVAFVSGTGAFRWMYLVTPDAGEAEEMEFLTNLKDHSTRRFSNVQLATRPMMRKAGFTLPYHLVEAVVNGGDGSGAEEAFVATQLRRIDGTPEFPQALSTLTQQLEVLAKRRNDQEKATIGTMFESARESVAKGRKSDSPDESTTRVGMTWLPDEDCLRVEITTERLNGFYLTSQGVDGAVRVKYRSGTQYGVETRSVFTVSKKGEVVETRKVPPQKVARELPPHRVP